jgi:autotransporter-associated beta strand protein
MTSVECLTAATIHVSTTGNDSTGSGQAYAPFATIQKGIFSAQEGDTVLVASGTYTGEGNRNINLSGKAITVKSAAGPKSVILDLQQNRAFIASSSESLATVIDGFTINGGYEVTGDDWGGIGIISIYSDAALTVKNCIFTDNKVEISYFTARANIIEDNSNSGSIIENCLFYGNTCLGGYWMTTSFSNVIFGRFTKVRFVTIANNNLESNSWGNWNPGGLAVSIWEGDGGLDSSIVRGNGNINTYCAYMAAVPNNNITDGTIIDPSSGSQTYLSGYIQEDPLFTSPQTGDFSLSLGSPAIDAGDPSVIDPDGTRSDIGFNLARAPTFDLTFTTPQYGSLSGAGSFSWGTTATLTATPNAGYIFSGWTGDASGTDNPLSLTMSSDKTVGAAFGPDLADSDGDGYSNHDEIVTYKSNPNNSASIPGDPDGDGFFVAALLEGTGLMDAVGGDTMIVNAAGTPLASGIAAGGYFTLSDAQVAAAVASEDYAQLLMAFVPFVSDDFVTGLRDYYIGDAIPGFHYFYQHLGTQPATLLGRPIYTFFGNGATLGSSTELALVKHSASITASNLSQSVYLLFDPYDDHALVLGAAGTGTYSSDAIGIFDVPVATIALHFVGAILPPEIAVEQPTGTNIANNGSKDFGNVGLGLNSSLTFTISNSGDFPLSLSGTPRVAISGTNAADFTVTAQPDASVAAGGTTTFTVSFAPSALGERSADLTIANNDDDENPFVINLSGAAVLPPEIAVEQPVGTNIATSGTQAFGNVGLGLTNSLTFTIRNSGDLPLSLSGTTRVAISGTNADDFTVTTQPDATIAANGTTTFTVRFAPSVSVGARSAQLSITNNDSDENPFVINLSGTAVLPPEIAVEQPVGANIATSGTQAFGDVGLGLTNSLTFTIRNSGDFPLSLSGTPRVAISGANAADFTVTADPDATVAAAGSTTFTVRFAPSTVVGARSAQLSIANNDSDEDPFVINLSGTAVTVGSDLFWDTVSDDGAVITSGSGMWNTAAGNMSWSNGSSNMAWTQTSTTDGSNAAVFAGTDGAANQYTVTLGAQMATESVTFNSSGYRITGSTLAVMPTASTSGTITVAANKTATINSILRYNHNTGANVTVSSGGTLNLGGGTTAAFNPQFNFSGAGTINLIGGTFTSNIGNYGNAVINLTSGTHAITPGVNVGAVISSGIQNVAYNLNGGTLTVNGNSTARNNSFLGIGNGTSTAFTSTLNVISGTMNVGTDASTAGEIRISGTNAASNGTLNVSGGTVTVGTGKTDNKIYFFKSGADAGYTANMTQSGGTVTANGIQFGGTSGTYNASSAANLTLSGGSLYVGLQGITSGSAASALPVTIRLEGGTIGASDDWSSSLEMKLGATGGGPTFQAATSGDVSKNITLSGVLSDDDSVNGTLTKTGAGMLTLSGANTYTGATTINAGTLALGASDVLPNLSAVSIGSATLEAATFADTAGTLDPTGAAAINLGTGATLAFADSSLVDWTGGTLNINGTFVSGSSLRFGTTSGGLTSTQLNSITSSGFSGFSLNENGYLVGDITPLTLSISTPTNGVITGAGEYEPGDIATLTATPNPGYIFAGWTGGASGADNPLSLTMNTDKIVGANFERDLGDADGDGLSNYAEVVTHGTNPDLADTDGDGFSDGVEVESGSDPKDPESRPDPNPGPLFTEITNMAPSLAKHSIIAVMDYNKDSKEDLLAWTDSGTRLLKQTGSFQFDDVTSASGLDGLQSALVADFTNDGLEDIIDIASDKTYASIRMNNGEGYYVKSDLNQVLEGDLGSYRDLMTGDIDNDGDIDLIYAVNPPFGGGAVAYLPNITVRGAQNVQFGQKSYLVRTSWQFAKFDLTDANNDGLTDLVILQTNGSWPNDTHPDHPAVLYLGTGRGQNDYLNPDGSSSYVGFVEKANCGINAANEMSRFTSWDIDNDGDLDLINGSSDWRWVSNPHIYINDGAGNYTQQSSPVYHSGQYYHHGITIFDADADNDLDAVWTGLHNFSNIYPRMWKNEGSRTFTDATVEWGITSKIPGSGNLGSSGYAADLDNDGDQDFVVQGGNGWGSENYYAVYLNNANLKGSKCLKIELEGSSSHAKGFGARVEVRANGKTLTQWVSNHVGSVPTTRLHFGLGQSHDVEFINVYWPSGLKSSLSNPTLVENVLKITEPPSPPTPRFQVIEGSFTWREAKADAEARGGRLAVLDTQEKIEEANALIPTQGLWPSMWIGLTDETSEGQWKWITGNDLSISNWNSATGEPNNGNGNEQEDYALIQSGWQYKWNDGASYHRLAYLFESINPSFNLTLNSSPHGSVSGVTSYQPGSMASLSAMPDPGYIFSGWTGDVSGTANPLSLMMDADKTVGATFGPDLSDSDSDGLSNYDEIITHGTNPLVADTDGDGYSDGIEIQNGTNPLDPASVPTFDLTLTTPQYGSLSGAGTYPLNTNATLAATANPGYIFTKWTGDASGTENPLSLNMNADKTVGATFEQDLGDADGDGLSNYREAVVYGTNPAKADTDDDGLSDAWELGVGRFSLIVTASPLTWKQARDDARSKGGDLACFPNQGIWNTVRAGLGETALDDLQGVWIGASDAEVEGTWKWVNGLPFTFANWGSGRPNSTAGNSLDFLEISGGDGAELWKWYDRGTTSTRTRYLLEVGYSTNPLIADADADGLTDGKEQEVSTNPFLSDSDSDGLTDGEEISLVGTNPNQADSDGDSLNDANDDQDGDGLSNISEIRTHLTNPVAADSDADGLNDGAEINDHSTNPNVADSDGDGLTDGEEIKLVGTNPTQVDSDGDSLNDANDDQDGDGLGNLAEIRTHFTNPINPDSDSDNLTDREEIELTFTNPNHADSDGDNINDADDDQDGDGLNNLVELRTHLTNPAAADSDGDALTDTEEITLVGTNPNQADSDGDSLNDANDDQDGDGLSNISEIRTHLTNPVAADGDGDGLNDGAEINEYSTNPFLSDTDGDGLTDGHEVNTTQSNPKLADSNGDGLRDGLVVALGKNPMENISAFMSALMANRTELGLHKTEDITDMRAGSMMIERAAGADKLQFRMKLQRSNDLHNWQDDGEAVFEAPMGPSPSKQFYRFGVK